MEPENNRPLGLDQVKEEQMEASDIEKNRGIAVVAYILFFVPLLAAKDSRFAMYHANQGLLLLISAIIVNVVGSIIPFLGWLIILPLGNLLVFVLLVLGILNAAGGKAKPLPLIGKFKII